MSIARVYAPSGVTFLPAMHLLDTAMLRMSAMIFGFLWHPLCALQT